MTVERTFTDLTDAGFDNLGLLTGSNDNNRLPTLEDRYTQDRQDSVKLAEDFSTALDDFLEVLEDSGDVEEVYITGIREDAIGSLLRKFDQAVGQLGVANDVKEAGAGKHKVSEYLENSKGYFTDMNEELSSLKEWIRDEDNVSLDNSKVSDEFTNLSLALDKFMGVISSFNSYLSIILDELS
jgi:hypothetical protein